MNDLLVCNNNNNTHEAADSSFFQKLFYCPDRSPACGGLMTSYVIINGQLLIVCGGVNGGHPERNKWNHQFVTAPLRLLHYCSLF